MHIDTLYIIGNGFDLAHGLPTSYSDFYTWLTEQAESDEKLRDTIRLLIHVIGDCEKAGGKENKGKWSHLEEYCADIKLSQGGINLMDRSWFDDEGEEHDLPYSHAEKGEEVSDFVDKVGMLNTLFFRWINNPHIQAGMKEAASRKISYFTENMETLNYVVLNFNYTDTLEKLYGVDAERICHIHGKCDTAAKYYFGHGRRVPEPDKMDGLKTIHRYVSDHLSDDEGVTFPNIQISKRLFKDVVQAADEHMAFFAGLSGLRDIYVYGFGFGTPDMYYLNQINKRSPNAVWHIHQYKGKQVSNMVLKKLQVLNTTMDIQFWNVE